MKPKKLYRYSSNGEGIFSAGKRLLPSNLVQEADEARKWLPKPQLPPGEYSFYWTEDGCQKYEQTLLLVHKKYLTNRIKEEIDPSTLMSFFYEDPWQVVIKR